MKCIDEKVNKVLNLNLISHYIAFKMSIPAGGIPAELLKAL